LYIISKKNPFVKRFLNFISFLNKKYCPPVKIFTKYVNPPYVGGLTIYAIHNKIRISRTCPTPKALRRLSRAYHP